jgi:hypothetical protein
MSPCLQPGEIIDYVDGVLDAERASHVATCSTCQATAADVHAVLAEAAAAEIPEPSPFFWSSINRRVAAALTAPPAARDGWQSWLAWDTLLPVAAMGAVLMALGAAIARPPAPTAPTAVAAPAALPVSGDAAGTTAEAAPTPADDALALVVDLAGTLRDAGADALALAPLPDLGDVAATALSDDELQALEVLLRAAVDRPKS